MDYSTGIIDLLDPVLVEQDFEMYSERTKNPLRPSAAGKCGRALAHEFQEYKGIAPTVIEDKKASVVRLLSLGNHIERALINDLRKLEKTHNIILRYLQQTIEVCTLDDGTIIEGQNDFALEGPDGFKLLCDSKSAKDGFSAAFKTKWDSQLADWVDTGFADQVSETLLIVTDTDEFCEALGDDYKLDNIQQLNVYLGSPFFKQRGYEWASLMYYNKNDSRIFELRFRYSKKLHDKVIDKFKKVASAKKPEEVEKDFFLGSIRCAFCPYKDRCWGEDAMKSYFKATSNSKSYPVDISYFPESKELKELFEEYFRTGKEAERHNEIEQEICEIAHHHEKYRIMLDKSTVYDVKLFKSPKPHFELRRSRLGASK